MRAGISEGSCSTVPCPVWELRSTGCVRGASFASAAIHRLLDASARTAFLSRFAERDLDAPALIAAPDVQFNLIPRAIRFERRNQVNTFINFGRSKANYAVAGDNEAIAANAGGDQSRAGSRAVRIDSEDQDAGGAILREH